MSAIPGGSISSSGSAPLSSISLVAKDPKYELNERGELNIGGKIYRVSSLNGEKIEDFSALSPDQKTVIKELVNKILAATPSTDLNVPNLETIKISTIDNFKAKVEGFKTGEMTPILDKSLNLIDSMAPQLTKIQELFKKVITASSPISVSSGGTGAVPGAPAAVSTVLTAVPTAAATVPPSPHAPVSFSMYTHEGLVQTVNAYRINRPGQEDAQIKVGSQNLFISLEDAASLLGVTLEKARDFNRAGKIGGLVEKQNSEGANKIQNILNQELGQLLGLDPPDLSKPDEVNTFNERVQELGSNNDFINGLFKLQYLPVEHYNSMRPLVSPHKIEDAKKMAQLQKNEYRAGNREKREQIIDGIMGGHLTPARMGYNKHVVDVLNKGKYPLDQIVKADGSFMKAPANISALDMAILEQVDVGHSERLSEGIGKALENRMHKALSSYLEKNGNAMPKALQIPFSHPDHTMLLVIEQRGTIFHLSVLDSLAPGINNGFNKKDALAGAKKALLEKFPDCRFEEHYLEINQNNNNCCGMHVQMNMDAVGKAIKNGNKIHTILGKRSKEEEFFPQKTPEEMRRWFLRDQALAVKMSEALFFKFGSKPKQGLEVLRDDSWKRLQDLQSYDKAALRAQVEAALTD